MSEEEFDEHVDVLTKILTIACKGYAWNVKMAALFTIANQIANEVESSCPGFKESFKAAIEAFEENSENYEVMEWLH